ncbi:MAG: hypothetical protein P4M09_00580 [Devosia sp.]|nr:hypothetical protein [Devosia sp.]
MRTKFALIAALLVAAGIAVPAFAAESMMSSNSMAADHGTMMKKGEAMVIMPNGETISVMTQGGAGEMAAMQTAKPLDKCTILMMGKDGKMYLAEDSKMSNGKMVCDDLSTMKH